MSTKRNQNEVDNFGTLYEGVYGNSYKMNTFIPAFDYALDYIVLEGKRVGNCVSVDVNIFITDGAHKPTESSLVTAQVLQATIGTSEAETTFTFGSSLSLSSGIEYAVVISCAGPDNSNSYQISYGFSNTGRAASSTNAGTSWSTPSSAIGYWFQAWGSDPISAVTLIAQINKSRLVAIGNDELWYEDI